MLSAMSVAAVIGVAAACAFEALRGRGHGSRWPGSRWPGSRWPGSRWPGSRWPGSRWLAKSLICILVIASATPLIIHATAWEATAGKFGISLLTQTGSRVTAGDQYGFFAGFVATAWIHGVHGASIVGLIFIHGFNRIPVEIREMAVIDTSPIRRWLGIYLPAVSPWLGTGLLITALLAASEMTVADLYGFRTIADQFYLYHAAAPDLHSVFITCIIPVFFVAAITALVRGIHAHHESKGYVPAGHSNHLETANPQRYQDGFLVQAAAAPVAITVILILIAVPLAGLINNLGQEVTSLEGELIRRWTFQSALLRLRDGLSMFMSEFQWTAVISISTAIVSTAIAWPLAAMSWRNAKIGQTLHFAAIVSVCLPGPIVGLIIVSIFQCQVPGFRFFYQQTVLPTVLALLFRGLPIAFWICQSGYRQFKGPMFDLVKLDLSPWQALWKIEWTLLRPTLAIAFVAVAITSSGDLAASLPVIPAGVTTVPVRLFGLLHSGARYQETSLVIWYVVFIALLAIVVVTISRDRKTRKSRT